MADSKGQETEINQENRELVIQIRRKDEELFQKINQLLKRLGKAKTDEEVTALKTGIKLLEKEREATNKILKENAVNVLELIDQSQVDSLKECLIRLENFEVAAKAKTEINPKKARGDAEKVLGSDVINIFDMINSFKESSENLDLDKEKGEGSGNAGQESGCNADSEATTGGKEMPFSLDDSDTSTEGNTEEGNSMDKGSHGGIGRWIDKMRQSSFDDDSDEGSHVDVGDIDTNIEGLGEELSDMLRGFKD